MAKKRTTKKPTDAPNLDYIAADLRPLAVPIADLVADPHNARTHNEPNLAAIRASLEKFGQRKPVVVNRRNKQVEAGNGLVQSAGLLGWTHVAVVWVDDDPSSQRGFALADNRTAELAEWDDACLEALCREWQDGGEQLDLYEALQLDALLGVPEVEEEVVEDEVPVPPKEPITKPGDLWILGDHRLLCGDCREAAGWKRVMQGKRINVCMTSPPYASQRKYDESSGFKPIKPAEYVAWWEPLQACVKQHLASDGSFFVNIKPACEGLERELYVFDLVVAMKRRFGWLFAEEFCWQRTGIPQQVARRFKNQFEPVYQFTVAEWKFRPDAVRHASGCVPIAQGPGAGDTNAARRQGRVSAVEGNEVAPGLAYPGNRLTTFAETHEAMGHSAAFPVGLPSFFIRAFSDEGDNVADPFLGSGTTLIAAEQLGRKCYGMEISPAYCDVIVKRWETFTGKKARRKSAVV